MSKRCSQELFLDLRLHLQDLLISVTISMLLPLVLASVHGEKNIWYDGAGVLCMQKEQHETRRCMARRRSNIAAWLLLWYRDSVRPASVRRGQRSWE